MTAAPVHDLAEQRLAELLAQLFARSSARARLGHGFTEHAPLDESVLLAHVQGRDRAGAIPFVSPTEVWWACIDLDVLNWDRDPEDAEVFGIINGIVERLAALGIRAALERSKSKGWHLWCFFDGPVLARDARSILRSIALEAGAKDAADLVCPRQDRLDGDEVGNGTWLPLFGGDHTPKTRFFVADADSFDWIEAENQSAVLRELVNNPNPAGRIPRAQPTHESVDGDLAWTLDELRDDHGIRLENVSLDRDRIRFRCPLHDASRRNQQSAVLFAEGNGHCSSTRCEAKWRSLREFVALCKGGAARDTAHELRVLTPAEFAHDVAPPAIVERLIYRSSVHNQTGTSKAGKTWCALQLAMSTVGGVPFLGLASRQSAVLYLSLELSAGMLRERMHAIQRDTGVPMPEIGDQFHVVAPIATYAPRLDLGTDAGAGALAELIGQTRAELVVLDTLYRFLPGRDPNSNQEMGECFGRLNELAQTTGVALLLLDHVGKGEHVGPVSHSGLGASVKGGAARSVISLRRTSKQGAGSWELDVESHFGSWEEPLYYTRPTREDGSAGSGCVAVAAAEAFGLGLENLEELFRRHGEPDEQGRPAFASKRRLIDALKQAGHATGDGDGAKIIAAVEREYCAPKGQSWRGDLPVGTAAGPRNAIIYTWLRGAQ